MVEIAITGEDLRSLHEDMGIPTKELYQILKEDCLA